MATQLTQRLIANLEPESKPYEVVDPTLRGFLVRVQPSGIKSFYYSYRAASGKRHRVRLGPCNVVTLSDARLRAQALGGQVATGNDPHEIQKRLKAQTRKEQLNTLGAFIDEEYAPWFLEYRKGGPRVISQAKRIYAFLLNIPMKDITPLMIDRWRTQKHQAGTKKETINRYMATLRSMLNKAVDWDVIDKNPLRHTHAYKVDTNKHVERYLSSEEEMNLRYALDEREQELKDARRRYNEWNTERDYPLYPDLAFSAFADHLTPIVLLAMNTGMRRGELFTLTWHSISFEHRLLTVRGEHAKSGQSRHIPLNDEALSVLQRWKKQHSDAYWVFPGQNGKPITDIKKSWSSVLTRAKITHFRFHDLRHHFASQLVMAGVDLNTIRELLGHRDYSSTLRYAHLAPRFLAEAVAKLKPRYWGDCKPVAIMR